MDESHAALRQVRVVIAAAALLAASQAAAQTPSPFPYWQNDAGIVLAPMAGPLPDWRVALGIGIAATPLYEGSDHYHIDPAPAFDIRYRDLAFVSSGDGLGVNLLHGDNYRAGIALAYDVGRESHTSGRLNGLGSIDAAPEAKLFAEYVWLPFIVAANVRRGLGGHNGFIGDLGIYAPVVGNETLVLFVGPTATFADDRYTNRYFGVDPAQAAGSTAHFPFYKPGGGIKSTGFGVTGIYHITETWLVDANLGYERLLDGAANSPIVQDPNQFGASATLVYQW